MSADDVWNDPEVATNNDFIKLEGVGDRARGRIVTIKKHTFDDGKVVPQVLLTDPDGAEKTLTAGQVRLKTELVERRPQPGDYLDVSISQVEKRAGGKTLKHFDVLINGVDKDGKLVDPNFAGAPAVSNGTPATGAVLEQTGTPAPLTEEQKEGMRTLGIPVPGE